MSEEKKQNIVAQYYYLILAIVIFAGVLTVIELATTDEVKIPVPCSIIMSNAIPTPDNVITKGYDVLRNQTGTPTITSKMQVYYKK
jgi:hypothetical protein